MSLFLNFLNLPRASIFSLSDQTNKNVNTLLKASVLGCHWKGTGFFENFSVKHIMLLFLYIIKCTLTSHNLLLQLPISIHQVCTYQSTIFPPKFPYRYPSSVHSPVTPKIPYSYSSSVRLLVTQFTPKIPIDIHQMWTYQVTIYS